LQTQLAKRSRDMDVAFNRMYLRSQRTKWGNCSPLRNLSFNGRLVMAPPSVLDYIVVHELAHLRESAHSARFWLVVQSYGPDCAMSRRWLTSHQDELLAGLR
jgi:predicted metal-dependent hydrolase